MNEQEYQYLDQLNTQLEQERLNSQKAQNSLGQVSMYSYGNENNLIQWQLDLREELERIEHVLRGHTIKRDDNGNEYWASIEDERFRPFNEYGVQLLMNVISFYLNRNTILSNYREDMINWKMKDLGDEIADLIFLKYDEMGMNTPEKKKLYGIIMRQILDSIHSAYLRAYNGGERDSLRTARHVSQSVSHMPIQRGTPQSQKRDFSIWKPSTWGGN